jgi:hypothetical protein
MRPNALSRTRVGPSGAEGIRVSAVESKPLSEEEKAGFDSAAKGASVGILAGAGLIVLGILWMKDA